MMREDIEKLPRTLTSLTLVASRNATIQNLHTSTRGYPRSLTKLVIPTTTFISIVPGQKEKTWRHSPGLTMHMLPPRLTYLDAPSLQMDMSKYSKTLPVSIQHLSIAYTGAINGTAGERLAGLPALTSLTVSGSHHTNLFMNYLPTTLLELSLSYVSDMDGNCLALLPRTLTSLTLTGCKKFSSDQSWATLPPGLTYLQLKNTRNVTGKGLQSLPRSLRSLHLESSSLEVHDADIDALPPQLQFLKIGPIAITQEGIKKLPKTLTSLEVGEYSKEPAFSAQDLYALLPHAWHIRVVIKTPKK